MKGKSPGSIQRGPYLTGDPVLRLGTRHCWTRQARRMTACIFLNPFVKLVFPGVVRLYHMDTQKRSPSADEATSGPGRNYLASEPTTDGDIIVYRLRMGTEKAKTYKALPLEERRQFLIDNYDAKIMRPSFNSLPA